MPKPPLCSSACTLLVCHGKPNMMGQEPCPHHDDIIAEARRRGMVGREEVGAAVAASVAAFAQAVLDHIEENMRTCNGQRCAGLDWAMDTVMEELERAQNEVPDA